MGSLVNRTSYDAPNVNVDTSGPNGTGLGGLGIDPFYMNMAKRRMMLAARKAAMENEAMEFDLGKKKRDLSFSDRTPDWGAEEEKIRDRTYKKQLQEADINPGKKMIGGFNINPGYIEDTTLLPVSMRPKAAGMMQAEENTAHMPPGGTGGYDQVASEKAARADLAGPEGSGSGGDFEQGLLQLTAEEAARKRLMQAQAQQQYFSGRG